MNYTYDCKILGGFHCSLKRWFDRIRHILDAPLQPPPLNLPFPRLTPSAWGKRLTAANAIERCEVMWASDYAYRKKKILPSPCQVLWDIFLANRKWGNLSDRILMVTPDAEKRKIVVVLRSYFRSVVQWTSEKWILVQLFRKLPFVVSWTALVPQWCCWQVFVAFIACEIWGVSAGSCKQMAKCSTFWTTRMSWWEKLGLLIPVSG